MRGPPRRPWFTLRYRPGVLELLDQRELPEREVILALRSAEEVARAIEEMAVRGAPAIGCAAAFGVALAARVHAAEGRAPARAAAEAAIHRLGRTRPTAVNLFFALRRMREALDRALRAGGPGPEELARGLEQEARALAREDEEACRAIGRAGAELVPKRARVLTHCNAGALATAGYGTALGVIRAAVERGQRVEVFADETRPLLQGARLTAWELARDGIPVTVIPDAAAAHLMRRGEVDLVVVGADRVARNGDVANKIGTFGLALLAREHGIPFYVAAPLSTWDPETASGAEIPIEERGRDEVARMGERTLVPEGVPVRNPAFDVTPAALVTALVTEAGVARPPFAASLEELAGRSRGTRAVASARPPEGSPRPIR